MLVSHGVIHGFVPVPAGNESIPVSPSRALHVRLRLYEQAVPAAGAVPCVQEAPPVPRHSGSQLAAQLRARRAERVITSFITMFSHFAACVGAALSASTPGSDFLSL